MRKLAIAFMCLCAAQTLSAQTGKKPFVLTKITVNKPKPAPLVPIKVTVNVAPEVTGQSFTLGEIADITGSDKATVKQLNGLLIGTSPLPGMTRMLRPGDITIKLRGAHLESPNVEVVAPPEMSIARAKSDVAFDEVIKAALPLAQAAIKDMTETTLEPTPLAGQIMMPKGTVTFLAGAVRGDVTLGKLTVPVALRLDGKTQQTLEVNFTVRRRTRVLIACRTLEPNEILTMEDVAFAKIDLPSGFVRPVQAIKDALGKRVKMRINADAPLSLNGLDTPPAVKFGDRVVIEFVFGAVRITAPGVVRGTGAIGETVRVNAPDTKKDLDAVIVDAHTVRIADIETPTETLPNAPESDPNR